MFHSGVCGPNGCHIETAVCNQRHRIILSKYLRSQEVKIIINTGRFSGYLGLMNVVSHSTNYEEPWQYLLNMVIKIIRSRT